MQHGGFAAAENGDPPAYGFDEQDQNHSGEDGSDDCVQPIIENEALGECDFCGRKRAGRNLRGQDAGLREKSNARIRGENFLVAGRHGDGYEPDHGHKRDPNPARATHFQQDRGDDHQSDGSE